MKAKKGLMPISNNYRTYGEDKRVKTTKSFNNSGAAIKKDTFGIIETKTYHHIIIVWDSGYGTWHIPEEFSKNSNIKLV